LDTLNPLPPLSPEIEGFLATFRTTPSEEIKAAPAAVFEEIDYPMRWSREDLSTDSIVSDIVRERQDYEESLDDRFLGEANRALEQKIKWFQKQLEQLDKDCREKLELEQINLQRRIEENQEAMRLEELRKLVLPLEKVYSLKGLHTTQICFY
jgi:hypothetical protein